MKTKRHLKRWAKECMVFMVLITTVIVLMVVNKNLSKDFVKNCENAGYSHNYCLNHNN